jgi:hypothetical protein
MLAKCHEHLSFGEIRDEFCWPKYFWLGLQFGYIWANCKHKWIIVELVKRELLIFRRYQLNVKDIKCFLQWW